jgi:holo-[acyl-carrier protein] synthase
MKSDKSPILGLGNDIIEIERIRDSIDAHGDRFLARIFSDQERAYCLKHKDPAPRFAGRFAAKEAIAKAFGTGIGKEVGWKDIEILNNSLGKPEVFLSPALQQRFKNPTTLLSISHCKHYATAVALWIL